MRVAPFSCACATSASRTAVPAPRPRACAAVAMPRIRHAPGSPAGAMKPTDTSASPSKTPTAQALPASCAASSSTVWCGRSTACRNGRVASIGISLTRSGIIWIVRIADMNWMQLEEYLERDERIVLPLGCTEQHAYISLATDSILAERVAVEAAEPLGVPVLPALVYGLTPYFAAFPGSPSLREETYLAVVGELLDSLRGQGFARFLLVNGHGGNKPVEALAGDSVVIHHWWAAPRTRAVVDEIDPDASHASWMETFPWTKLPGVELPEGKKE